MGEQNRRMQYMTDAGSGVGAVAAAVQTYSPHGRKLLITAAGNITFKMSDGSTVVWAACPVGLYDLTVSEITAIAATGYVIT
jgi:hypothetical protein